MKIFFSLLIVAGLLAQDKAAPAPKAETEAEHTLNPYFLFGANSASNLVWIRKITYLLVRQ